MQVKELMTADVVTVGRNDELSVADDGKLVGLLTESDFVKLVLSDS